MVHYTVVIRNQLIYIILSSTRYCETKYEEPKDVFNAISSREIFCVPTLK